MDLDFFTISYYLIGESFCELFSISLPEFIFFDCFSLFLLASLVISYILSSSAILF